MESDEGRYTVVFSMWIPNVRTEEVESSIIKATIMFFKLSQMSAEIIEIWGSREVVQKRLFQPSAKRILQIKILTFSSLRADKKSEL